MSNIVISGDADDLRALPADILEGQLESFTREGAFAGGYAGPAPAFDETLEDRVAALFSSDTTPRLSGVQIKAPMNLSHAGALRREPLPESFESAFQMSAAMVGQPALCCRFVAELAVVL